MTKFDAAQMDQAEQYHCRANALIAGVSKILGEFVNGESWGHETTVDVAIGMLSEAKEAHKRGNALMTTAFKSRRRVRKPKTK